MWIKLGTFLNFWSWWTLESIRCLQSICICLAVLSISVIWPVADTSVLIKPETRCASVLLGLSIGTSVENMTNRWVWVRVETIETGTQVTGTLWRLEIESVSTVYVKEVITWFSLS